MSPLARFWQVAACFWVLAFPMVAGAADPAAATPVKLAPKVTVEIARSALVSVEGTVTGDSLRLQLLRLKDKSLIDADGVTATIDGKSEPVGRAAGGYELSLDEFRGTGDREAGRDLEIVVPHDGIREILSGRVALAQPAEGGSILRDHRQIAWWIVNIVVVLIAALVLSRRKA